MPGLLELDNVVVVPHIASATTGSIDEKTGTVQLRPDQHTVTVSLRHPAT